MKQSIWKRNVLPALVVAVLVCIGLRATVVSADVQDSVDKFSYSLMEIATEHLSFSNDIIEEAKRKKRKNKRKKRKNKSKSKKKKKKKNKKTSTKSRTQNYTGNPSVTVDTCSPIDGERSQEGDLLGGFSAKVVITGNKARVDGTSDSPTLNGTGDADGFNVSGSLVRPIQGVPHTFTTAMEARRASPSTTIHFFSYSITVTDGNGALVCQFVLGGTLVQV